MDLGRYSFFLWTLFIIGTKNPWVLARSETGWEFAVLLIKDTECITYIPFERTKYDMFKG